MRKGETERPSNKVKNQRIKYYVEINQYNIHLERFDENALLMKAIIDYLRCLNFVVYYNSRVFEFAHFKFAHQSFIFSRSLKFAQTRKYTG